MKTDKQIQQDVIDELSWEPSVNSEHIGVEVSDGVVTLAGHVGSYTEKFNAERATQRVAGVKALAVEMDIKLAGTTKRTDADIARSVEETLRWATYVPSDSIKVKVEGGRVSLSGEVEWDYQRQTALDAVRFLSGITGLSDQISIKPKASSKLVKSDIEAALKRRATNDAQKIAVSVEGGDVTLTGSVHSWSERDLARESAWGSPGVRNVVDKMTVSYY